MRGYDYDRGYRSRGPIPPPGAVWFPGAYMGQTAVNGWGWWGGPWDLPPYPRIAGNRYDEFIREMRPIDPRQSGTYGRAGDLAAKRWAERYGYDFEMAFRPRRGRYDWR